MGHLVSKTHEKRYAAWAVHKLHATMEGRCHPESKWWFPESVQSMYSEIDMTESDVCPASPCTAHNGKLHMPCSDVP